MGTPIHAAKEMGWYNHLRKGCDYLLRFNMNIPYDLVITLIYILICVYMHIGKRSACVPPKYVCRTVCGSFIHEKKTKNALNIHWWR